MTEVRRDLVQSWRDLRQVFDSGHECFDFVHGDSSHSVDLKSARVTHVKQCDLKSGVTWFKDG